MGKIDPGDTAWLLTSAAFVLLMTPGLPLFTGAWSGRKMFWAQSCIVL